MNANGTNVRALADSFDVRGAASWSPDGKWVAVAANQGDGTRLFKIPLDGGQPVRLLDTRSYQSGLVARRPVHRVFRTAGQRVYSR